MRIVRFDTASDREERSPFGVALFCRAPRLVRGLIFSLWFLVCAPVGLAQTSDPPVVVFNQISVQLDSAGLHNLTANDMAAIAAGSSDPRGITNLSVIPRSFNFCDIGQQPITLSVQNSLGETTTGTGSIVIQAPVEPPRSVYVDSTYAAGCRNVGFPNGQLGGSQIGRASCR